MGHLINPISTRLSIVRVWNANWTTYANNLKYTYLLNNDFYLYAMLKVVFRFNNEFKSQFYKNLILSHFYILRSLSKVFIVCFIYNPSDFVEDLHFMHIFKLWLKKKRRRRFFFLKKKKLKKHQMIKKKNKLLKVKKKKNVFSRSLKRINPLKFFYTSVICDTYNKIYFEFNKFFIGSNLSNFNYFECTRKLFSTFKYVSYYKSYQSFRFSVKFFLDYKFYWFGWINRFSLKISEIFWSNLALRYKLNELNSYLSVLFANKFEINAANFSFVLNNQSFLKNKTKWWVIKVKAKKCRRVFKLFELNAIKVLKVLWINNWHKKKILYFANLFNILNLNLSIKNLIQNWNYFWCKNINFKRSKIFFKFDKKQFRIFPLKQNKAYWLYLRFSYSLRLLKEEESRKFYPFLSWKKSYKSLKLFKAIHSSTKLRIMWCKKKRKKLTRFLWYKTKSLKKWNKLIFYKKLYYSTDIIKNYKLGFIVLYYFYLNFGYILKLNSTLFYFKTFSIFNNNLNSKKVIFFSQNTNLLSCYLINLFFLKNKSNFFYGVKKNNINSNILCSTKLQHLLNEKRSGPYLKLNSFYRVFKVSKLKIKV